MKVFNRSLFFGSVAVAAFSLGLGLHAQADEPASAASPSVENSPSSKIQFRLPKKEDFHFTELGGGIGGSEEGFSLQGHAKVEDSRGNYLRLTGTVGAPFLQGRLQGEGAQVELKKLPVGTGSNGDMLFQLEVIPLSADAQLQLSSFGQGSNSFLIVDPKLAASFDWLSPESMRMGARIRTTLGPAGGVVHDGDGTSGIIGIQVGVEGEFSYMMTDQDQLDFLCGVSVLNPVHEGLEHAGTRSRCEVGYSRVLGQDGSVRLAFVHEGSDFDVTGDESGASGFTGLVTTFTLPASNSSKGN